jgi:ribonuclease D
MRALAVEIITTQEALLQACAALACAPTASLDTEFMRESTYFPQLCLVQIATADALWLFDPLAVELNPLWATLNARTAPLVLHSAEQDLELMYLATHTLPPTLRDSQIAAAFLGMGDQIGYGNLVQQITGITLDKSQSRTNWADRPLTAAQCQYAADDVRYLAQIYPELCQRLADSGRLAWFEEDCAALSNPQRFEPQTSGLWQRVRGQQLLRSSQRRVLQAIALWREQWARRLDVPRRWVLSDEQALELANSRGFRADILNSSQNTRHRLTPDQIHDLRAAVDRARQLPADDSPEWRSKSRLDPATTALLALMHTKVQAIGRALEISPALLATTDDLLTLITAPEAPCKLNQGWRSFIVGAPLKALLP